MKLTIVLCITLVLCAGCNTKEQPKYRVGDSVMFYTYASKNVWQQHQGVIVGTRRGYEWLYTVQCGDNTVYWLCESRLRETPPAQ